MRLFRSILSAAFFVLFGIGGLLFSFLLILPVSKSDARKILRLLFRFFVWAGEKVGLFRILISGEDRRKLKSTTGSVVVSNHQTLIDAVILISLLGDSVCVTKEAVSRNPFMRVVARRILVVNDGPVTVVRSAARYLGEGVNVVVFPEGTRIPASSKSHVFHRGAAHIALQANANVELVQIGCDIGVLAKGQAWWDVGDRTAVYSVKSKGTICSSNFPNDEKSSKNTAVKLTEAIQKGVFS
ncbi:MAG: 1-acyl-sn-glycerol-3-phosphate acyltransferase [Kiritimatiellae bacterium]|nr:1-acyl-sn-glycerol-3-phosphate acyltransferase [Kiritimatiellia bacterium]